MNFKEIQSILKSYKLCSLCDKVFEIDTMFWGRRCMPCRNKLAREAVSKKRRAKRTVKAERIAPEGIRINTSLDSY